MTAVIATRRTDFNSSGRTGITNRVDTFDSVMQLDCSRTIAGSEYHFFFPLEINNFILSYWCKSALSNSYAVTLYENGELVAPTFDVRFRQQPWASRCSSASLSQQDLRDIVDYLLSL
jgi:hypothetical protein